MNKVTTHADGTQTTDFQFDTIMDGKAMAVTSDDDGSLYIEGYASDFGLDRQDDAFEPGAFDRGIKSFMNSNPVMLFHHKFEKALGQFTEARLDDNGLFVKGRIDKPAQGSWAEDVYNKVKSGTIKGLSVGGRFTRRRSESGWKISDVDLCEISVTPLPVNPRTTFAVIAGKAFESVELPTEEEVAEAEIRDEDKETISWAVASLTRVFDNLDKRGAGAQTESATPITGEALI